MELSLEIPPEAEAQMLYLPSGKATGWLKQSPKLHRIYVPKEILARWYDAIKDDDPVRRSKVRLRERARKELRMRVSERQIDRLVAGEARKSGRPHAGKTPIAA